MTVDFLDIKRRADELRGEADAFRARMQVALREEQLAENERRTEEPSLWNDPEAAQQLMSDLARRRAELEPWRQLDRLCEDAEVLADLALEAADAESAAEVEVLLADARALLDSLLTEALFADPHDPSDAIVEINAGAGGTEACDWAAMLGRMYVRWAERHGFTADVIDSLEGEQVGVKSMLLEIHGAHAYGYLRSERGTHRLIRFSPFNAKNSRETSFASVDVIPDVTEDVDLEIRDEDLRIDTYRASSAGGQHVNKTESAIRVTHLPTGLVVTCQNERSQIKNRASAMRVLKARLLERQRREQEAEMAKLRGVKTDIAFGNQIRTYFLQPYTLVKDHRSDYETPNAFQVLEGDLDGLMLAFLQAQSAQRVAETLE